MKMDSTPWPPEGWESRSYAHGDHDHTFYVVGGKPADSRRNILLLHEFPGMSGTIIKLANMLATDFRVVLPSVFGKDGAPTMADSVKQICVRREVHVIARRGVSKDVVWLKDFIEAHVANDDAGFGVIGMCFSGNFALALAVDERVKAAVVAQPALPIWPSSLGLSTEDQTALRARQDLSVRGYRFRGDCRSPGAKLASAERLLGEKRIHTFTFPTPAPRHSTLTGENPSHRALADVRGFLRSVLGSAESATSTEDPDRTDNSSGS
jgi:dienelactone hydrolase